VPGCLKARQAELEPPNLELSTSGPTGAAKRISEVLSKANAKQYRGGAGTSTVPTAEMMERKAADCYISFFLA